MITLIKKSLLTVVGTIDIADDAVASAKCWSGLGRKYSETNARLKGMEMDCELKLKEFEINKKLAALLEANPQLTV